MGERHRRSRAGDAGQIVVLRHPIAPVAQRLDMPGEVERVAQRLAGVAALDDRRQIENGERDHQTTMPLDAPDRKPGSYLRPNLPTDSTQPSRLGRPNDRSWPPQRTFGPAG